MKISRPPRLSRPFVLAIICVTVVGCDSSAPDAMPASTSKPTATSTPPTTDSTTDPTTDPTVAASTSSEPSSAVAETSVAPPDPLTFGPGTFDLADPTVALSTLSSYVATLTVTFAGSKDGQDASWSVTRTSTTDRNAATRQLTHDQTGQAPGQRYLADVAGTRYERLDQQPCTATVPDEHADASSDVAGTAGAMLDDAEPAALLAGVLGAQLIGDEDVGGVPATHYTFDERSFGSLDAATSKGDVWVAVGGYVVRYSLTTSGAAAYLGHGVEGQLTWEYDLTSIDQPVAIAVPTDCPSGLIDAPLPPDAGTVVNRPGRTTYVTAATPADVAAFYQEQLAAAGWQSDGDVLAGADGSLAVYTRSGETMTVLASTVLASTNVDATTVTILLDRTLP